MCFESQPSLRSSILSLSVALVVTSLASTAVATPDLAGELPQTGDTVVAIDLTEIRDSALYDRGFELISDHADAAGFVTRLERDFGLDLRSDVDALVVTSDSPAVDAEMLDVDDPADAVDTAAAGQPTESLLLARGDFEVMDVLRQAADQLDARLHEDDDVTGSSVRTDGFELHALDDQTLAVAAGPPARLEQIRESLDGSPSGLTSTFERGVQQLGPGQGIYMMIEPTIRGDADLPADASFAGLALDLDDEVRLGTVVRLEDRQTVGRSAEQLDDVRQQADSNPMTGLLGLDPLLDNLSIQQSGDELVVRSSMSEREALHLLQQVESILQTERQLQQPLEGEGFDPDDESPSDDDQDDGQQNDSSDVEGIDAPFN